MDGMDRDNDRRGKRSEEEGGAAREKGVEKRCRTETEGRGEDEKESKKKFYENLFPIVAADRCTRLAVFGPGLERSFTKFSTKRLGRCIVPWFLVRFARHSTLSQRAILYFARFEEIVSLVEKFLN